VALHCDVAFALTVAGVQLTATEVMTGGTGCTVTIAVPDLPVSSVLVAVTVTDPAAAGAVSAPLDVIVPALAAQVTEEL
jgi:hypothetical protein